MDLLYINHYKEQGLCDVLVVDCAPTGETLRLLSFPDMARWYMNRLFPLERRVAAALGPFARGMLRLPVPGTDVFDSMQRLYSQLEQMRLLLLDQSTSSVRLVVNPEKMVVREAQRTFTYLNLYGYHTDLVVVQQGPSGDGRQQRVFQRLAEGPRPYLGLIQDSFDPVPVIRAPLMDREVVGIDTLREMGEHIFGQETPPRCSTKVLPRR